MYFQIKKIFVTCSIMQHPQQLLTLSHIIFGNIFSAAVKSKSAEVKDKLLEYIVHPSSGSLTANERHVSASDKLGKRYRNMAPVFSIDDDLDTPGEDTCILLTVKTSAITIT